MKRREFIALISGAAAWPAAARAQLHDRPVIGFLTGHSPSAFARQRLAALQKGLAEVGFVDGKSVAIEARWAEAHYDRLPALAANLIQQQVKVIITDTTPAALAAKTATTTIPIVFALSSDPVALGLVSSLDRPGGNLTGAVRLGVELGPKRLQLAHEILPAATSMALLVNATNPAIADPERTAVGGAARTLGLELQGARNRSGFRCRATATGRRGHCGIRCSLQRPHCRIGRPKCSPPDAYDLHLSRIRRCRWSGRLLREPHRRRPHLWRLCGPNFEGGEASGPTCTAVNQD